MAPPMGLTHILLALKGQRMRLQAGLGSAEPEALRVSQNNLQPTIAPEAQIILTTENSQLQQFRRPSAGLIPLQRAAEGTQGGC